MAIPLSYNVRNLIERKGTTLMTAVGIAMTVAVLIAALALAAGVKNVFAESGDPRQIVVLRKGVDAELSSAIMEPAFQEIKLMPGVAKNAAGEPMASGELITIVNLPSVDSPEGMNITVRGLSPVGLEMRDVKIGQGEWFKPGQRQITVGQSIAKRYADARIGNKVRFGRGEWEIVGIFTGGQSAANSEIWCDLNQLRADFDRQGNMSSVLVRASSEAEVANLIAQIKDNQRLVADPVREPDYYESMTSSGAALQYVGGFVAIVMAIGSGFAAMNTMYAAVARRTREIGTLRSLGFSRASILTSFVFESVALAVIGGVIGVLLAMPLNWVTTGVGNDKTFSEIAFNFRVAPSIALTGLIFAALIGLLGGFFPALAAARKDLLSALRDV
jgi:putative ABC transport system permease protein